MDDISQRFITVVKAEDIEGLKNIPKSDLHNHFILGGNRKYTC